MGLAVPAQLHLIEHGEQLLPGLLPTKVLYHLYKSIRQWKKECITHELKHTYNVIICIYQATKILCYGKLYYMHSHMCTQHTSML